MAEAIEITRYRVGLPHYANVAPLTHFLNADGFNLKQGVPTELNLMLLSGGLDLSLVSSVVFLEHQDRLALLPGFSVAVLGRVYSVNLFSKKPFSEVKTVALTTESATSVRLLKLLLGNDRIYRKETGGLELLERYDGVLLIGDRAIKAYAELLGPLSDCPEKLPNQVSGVQVTDLAALWYERTRLPFVFAVWAYRKNAPPPEWLIEQLSTARREGIARLGEVAEAEAYRLGVGWRFMLHYLWNFRYHLEKPDQDGLRAFAQELGLRANF